MQVIAVAKNIRVSPEKVRLVVDQINKMSPAKAITILDFIPKSSSKPLKKVINSAIANAKNNFGLDERTLNFKSILVNKGRVLKRSQPISRGRAHHILKRTSHIKVVLEGERKAQPKTDQAVPDKQDAADNSKGKVKNKNYNEKE